jgi:hypothetical protein
MQSKLSYLGAFLREGSFEGNFFFYAQCGWNSCIIGIKKQRYTWTWVFSFASFNSVVLAINWMDLEDLKPHAWEDNTVYRIWAFSTRNKEIISDLIRPSSFRTTYLDSFYLHHHLLDSKHELQFLYQKFRTRLKCQLQFPVCDKVNSICSELYRGPL